jgi:hypothetical protein
MGTGVRIGLAIALATGCGSRDGQASESGESAGGEQEGSSGAETAEASSPWLGDVPDRGVLTYDVSLESAREPHTVRMQVQETVRRERSIAVRLAPIGTPLDDEPVYPRWMVGEASALVGLEETAALTTEAGYAPIDSSGHIRTEASDSVAWRVPSEWLTPGHAVGSEEVSAGWRLAERVGDVVVGEGAQQVSAHRCVRLERDEGGDHATLLVCANVGLIESVRTAANGTVEERWRLVSVAGPPPEGAEMH